MKTLILSDLHLGSSSHADLLRRPDIRASLFEALTDIERVVLLGDVLELRHGPLRDAMKSAEGFFGDLGRALGDRELIITAGNHDHALVEPWLAARGEVSAPGPLGLEQLLDPEEVSSATRRIAELCSPARVRVAYPGFWVREDVYAMHGHYLDCHLTVPTLERLSFGAMSRLLGRSPSSFATVEDYEAIAAPVFAWRDTVARDARTGAVLNGMATVAAWRALGGGGGNGAVRSRGRSREMLSQARVGLRLKVLKSAFPLAVRALNRAGIGPLKPDISAVELRRAGLEAMGEVAARIGLGDAHVVFGHTHRAGPFPGDEQREWQGRAGARLVNCGSWTYASIFFKGAGAESPYWPGVCVVVDESGPPRHVRLLTDRNEGELKPAV